MIRALALSLLAAASPGCKELSSCPLSYLAEAASYVTADKVPLGTKSDCAGASRVLNEQGYASLRHPEAPPSNCTADPTDTPCGACLRSACCTKIDLACGWSTASNAAPLPPATCGAFPGVRSCILTAATDGCTAKCAGGAS